MNTLDGQQHPSLARGNSYTLAVWKFPFPVSNTAARHLNIPARVRYRRRILKVPKRERRTSQALPICDHRCEKFLHSRRPSFRFELGGVKCAPRSDFSPPRILSIDSRPRLLPRRLWLL